MSEGYGLPMAGLQSGSGAWAGQGAVTAPGDGPMMMTRTRA
jgi:hypothetical protein